MKICLKILFSGFMKIILFPIRIFPLKSRRIVFTALTGGDSYEYADNLKYICEALPQDEFQIIWVVAVPDRYRDHGAYEFVKHYSPKSFYYLLTAKVIVTTGAYAPWFAFRKSQYLINTWHGGGAYKKIENDKPDANRLTLKRAKFCANNISLFLSSCHKADEHLIRGAFLYQGEIMEKGTPRNDHLVNGATQKQSRKVRRCYDIAENEKILLYVPTYRPVSGIITLDCDLISRHLSGDGVLWRVLFRAHRYEADHQNIRITGDTAVNASTYPDVQELLCAADMLITDYSSIFWDYSFLMRPGFLYTPDLDDYLRSTGFYVDIHNWPYPIAKTQDELIDLLKHHDPEEMKQKIKEHHRFMGSFESGNACNYITDRIAQVCNN